MTVGRNPDCSERATGLNPNKLSPSIYSGYYPLLNNFQREKEVICRFDSVQQLDIFHKKCVRMLSAKKIIINMNIPNEFKDYLVVKPSLSDKDCKERFTATCLREIEERAVLLRNLRYDKRDAKKRVKQNFRWEFELSELPSLYNQADKIVDRVYAAKPPQNW